MEFILLVLFVAITIGIIQQWARSRDGDAGRLPLAVAFWRGAFPPLVATSACLGVAGYFLANAARQSEGNAFDFALLLLAALYFLLMAGVGFAFVWIKAIKDRQA